MLKGKVVQRSGGHASRTQGQIASAFLYLSLMSLGQSSLEGVGKHLKNDAVFPHTLTTLNTLGWLKSALEVTGSFHGFPSGTFALCPQRD